MVDELPSCREHFRRPLLRLIIHVSKVERSEDECQKTCAIKARQQQQQVLAFKSI